MVKDIRLDSLVKFSLQKRASPALFQSLLKQTNHRQEIQLKDLQNLISANNPFEPLLVAYFASTILSDQTTNFNFSSVLSSLSLAIDENQGLILDALTSDLRSVHEKPVNRFSTFDVSNIISSLFQYLKYILEQKKDNQILYLKFGRFLIQLLPQLIPQNPASITPEQNDLVSTFIIETKSQIPLISGQIELLFSGLAMKKSISDSLRSSVIPLSSITSTSEHSQYSTFLKNNKLAKYIWLNSSIMNWQTHKSGFLESFNQFISMKTNQNILNELVSIAFEGYIITSQLNQQNSLLLANWRLFLVKRLPLLIKQLKLKNVELSLTNALNLVDPKVSQAIKLQGGGGSGSDSNFDDMFLSFPSTTTDIRHELLRSCIASALLPQSAFQTVLKQDAAADSRPLPNDDSIIDESGVPVDLENRLSKTLISINTEFIPLEDSGLLEFLELIGEAEGSKQLEFSKLLLLNIERFIREDDISHLSRISLALGLSQAALHAVIFHLSPVTLIKPIMNYLDRWQSNTEDGNFQETYASFGCIFLLFILIVKQFNITLNELLSYKEPTSSQSFCIKFLTSIGTSKQIDPADTHKSEVLNSWVIALFDSGGISDDLMRLSTVQECFEIFPTIFQQVFIGCKQKLLDIDTVKGGLEYFLQPFLLGTVVGILKWAENYLWKNQDIELLISLLKTLITPLDLSGESIHMHRVVTSIYASELYNALSIIDEKASINNTIIADSELLSGLRQIAENQSYSKFFRLHISPISQKSQNISVTQGRDQPSLLELFHSQFQVLVNWSQSSSSPDFDVESFNTLLLLLGEEIVVDYFLHQIKTASQQSSKTLHTLIELSIYILITHYVTFSSDAKEDFVNSLKSETVGHSIRDYLSKYHHLLEVLIHKKTTEKDQETHDIMILFYDKLIEIAENLNAY